MSVDGPDCMWMFRTARQESAGADMCRVASRVVQRPPATCGRMLVPSSEAQRVYGDEVRVPGRKQCCPEAPGHQRP